MNDIASIARRVVTLGRENELSLLAGSIAFFAFFSIIPALLLVVAIGSLVGGEQFTVGAVNLFETYLSEEGSTVISEALTDSAKQIGASLVGVVALFWSALKVFRAIDLAFDRIYETEKQTSLPKQLLNATVTVTSISIGFTLILVVQILLVRLGPGVSVYLSLASVPVLIVGLLIVLIPLYSVMPPERIPLRHIVPGTVTAVIGLTVLQQVFHVYVSLASQYQAYGLIGGILLYLLWLYFGAFVLLLGAVVNVAIAESSNY